MADPDLLIRVGFSWADAAFMFAVAAYLVFVPPATRTKRVLAAYLVLLGFGELTIVSILYVPEGATSESITWLSARYGFFILRSAALVGLLWFFPAPPRLRSLHTPAFAFAGGLAAAGAVLWWLFRDAAYGPALENWPFLGGLLPEGFGLAPLAMLASAVWRAWSLPAAERRGTYTFLVLLLAGYFTNQYFFLRELGEAAVGVPGNMVDIWAARWASPLDWGHLRFTLGALAEFLGVGITVGLAWKARHFVAPLLIAWLGVLMVTLPQGQGAGWAINFVWAPLGTLYVAHRYRLFGDARAPGWVHHLMSLAALASVFLLVITNAVLILPDAPILLAVSLFIALALGVTAAVLVHPSGLEQLLRLAPFDPDDTERRVAAYRTAMQAELAAGLGGEAIRAKLRDLRAQLGISDREHAIMEHTLRAGTGARGVALQPGRRFLDRYGVVRELGQGGAGATYLCRDEQVGRDVVIKRLRAAAPTAESLGALLREASAVGALKHPHVVTLYDVERVGDEAFIVMEHLDGGSLAARIARGALPARAFRTVADDLLDGLGAVHAAGLVHRDVKPRNVLLTGEGRAKLADFGVAHIQGFETTYAPQGDGGAVGTVQYMSPEQARGRPCTPRSDLFSAAATLFEALTGRPYLEPQPGESAVELQMRAAAAQPFRAAWQGPAALRRWFARALDPDPARRFPSARAMRAALEEALADGARGAGPGRRQGPA